MAENTIEEMKRKITALENNEPLVVKTGTIVYIHPPEHPTEKFSKIEIGLDCTEIINGRTFKDYLGFSVSSYDKENYPKFDVTGDTIAFKPGDVVKVMCNCGGFSIAKDKKNGDRDIIYNNVGLVKIKKLSAADPAPNLNADTPPATPPADDDIPF